ncbi:MAG TPA: DUF3011 domain-containing protein [Xanthomonadaceae bacterium]|jgi:hypothetical protein
MDTNLRTIAAAAAAVAIAYSGQSFAQDPVTDRSTYVSDSGAVIHCVSTESGRSYCGKPHVQYVIAGPTPVECVRDRTWGVDDRGVWVTGGCVADFNTVPVAAPARVIGGARVVHCVPTASGRTYCGQASVRYVIEGGPNPICVQGQTWGTDEHGLWVSGHCTAYFDVADTEVAAPVVVRNDDGHVLHCVSTAGGRTFCGAPHRRYVVVGTPDPLCVENTTWGRDDERGVWVSGGCVADFRVDDD